MKIKGSQLKQIALATRNGFATIRILPPLKPGGYSAIMMAADDGLTLTIFADGNVLL